MNSTRELQTIRQCFDAMKIELSPNTKSVFAKREVPLQKPQPKSPKIRGPAGEVERMMFEKIEPQSSKKKRNGSPPSESIEYPESYSKFHALYGGNIFSNRQVEDLIKSRQREEKLKKSDGSSTSTHDELTDHDISDTVSQVSSKQSTVNTEKVKQINKNNAAINGLLEQNIIQMGDLKNSYRKLRRKAPVPDAERTASIPVEVEHPDIPNIIMHRFLVEGAPEVDGIDYTPDRLYVRNVISPQEVLQDVREEDFEFHKPKSSKKKGENGNTEDTKDIKNADNLKALIQNVKSDTNGLMYKFLFPEENGSQKSVVSESSEDYLSM